MTCDRENETASDIGCAKRPLLYLVALAFALCASLAIGQLAAKYVMLDDRDAEMTAAGFHISSSLLDEGSVSHAADVSPDGTFSFDVRNYEVRNVEAVSQVDISYRVSVSGGTLVSVTDGVVPLAGNDGVYVLPKGPGKVSHNIAVLPDEGLSSVSVRVEAVSPYERSLFADFDVSGLDVDMHELEAQMNVVEVKTHRYVGNVTVKWASGLVPNAGVNEGPYGWSVDYANRTATINASSESTYRFEFDGTVASSSSVHYDEGDGRAGAVIEVS